MTNDHLIDYSTYLQQFEEWAPPPQPVAEGTFTHGCTEAVKRIPRGNVLRHLVDADWNAKEILFPVLYPNFSSKERDMLSYGSRDLQFFAVKGKYAKSQIPALAGALVSGLKQFEKPKSAGALACLLPPSATVYFRGEHKDSKYFAQMAIENYLGRTGKPAFYFEMDFDRSDRTWFHGVLSLWLNTIEPEREYFEIGGALVARETLTQWLHDAKANKFCSADWEPGEVSFLRSKADRIKHNGVANSGQIDELMRGRVGIQDNSAHDASVIASNEDALARMNSKLRSLVKPTFSAVQEQVLNFSRSRGDFDDIEEGLTHLAGVNRFVGDTNNQLSKSSAYALQTLWAYTGAHKNRTVANNLRDATLLQLAIIGREKPCIFGCVGQLLGTLQGIDPAFSVSDNSPAVKDKLRDIAIRVQNHMDEQFKDTELDELEQRGALDEAVLAEIKVGAFRKTVDLELRCFDGVPPAFYQHEAEKLEAGFRV